jgi:type I restriction enzyme, S subunit
LGDVLTINHGYAFKGEYFDEAGSWVLLTPKNFMPAGGLDLSEDRCKRYEGPVKPGYLLESGDIVVAMTDLKQDAPILGSAGAVPRGRSCLHNQRIGRIEIDSPDLLDRKFAPWLLNSPHVRGAVRASATGATVKHTAPSRIEEIEVDLPTLGEQRRIASILVALDESIATNERRIELLEQTARSLYRNWFIHLRFPGAETAKVKDTSLGRVPVDWSVFPLSEIARITMGQSAKSEEVSETVEGPPFHQGVSDFGSEVPNTSRYCASARRHAKPLDILCSVRAPVGRLNVADQRMGIGRGLAAIRRRDGAQALLRHQLRQALGEEDSIGGGTIYKAISKDQLSSLPVVEADGQTVERFERAARPMLTFTMSLVDQNRSLRSSRDLLLPRLITGQLDTSDIDLGILTPAEPE